MEERGLGLGVGREGGAWAAVADVDQVWVPLGWGRGYACYFEAGVGDHG